MYDYFPSEKPFPTNSYHLEKSKCLEYKYVNHRYREFSARPFEADAAHLFHALQAHVSTCGFSIPEYQRDYSWDTDKVKRLMESASMGSATLPIRIGSNQLLFLEHLFSLMTNTQNLVLMEHPYPLLMVNND